MEPTPCRAAVPIDVFLFGWVLRQIYFSNIYISFYKAYLFAARFFAAIFFAARFFFGGGGGGGGGRFDLKEDFPI